MDNEKVAIKEIDLHFIASKTNTMLRGTATKQELEDCVDCLLEFLLHEHLDVYINCLGTSMVDMCKLCGEGMYAAMLDVVADAIEGK